MADPDGYRVTVYERDQPLFWPPKGWRLLASGRFGTASTVPPFDFGQHLAGPSDGRAAVSMTRTVSPLVPVCS